MLTVFVFMFYLALGFYGSPMFLVKDVQNKYAEAMTTLSVFVNALPNKTVVTATSVCNGTTPYVQLNWTNAAAENYDITRDSETLVSGISALSYQDINVVASQDYTYNVGANGASGTVLSDDVMVHVAECNEIPVVPDPDLVIVSVDNIDLTTYVGTPTVADSEPLFSGTSNMSNARMKFMIQGTKTVVANILANDNGYWSWKVPVELANGSYTLSVTARDFFDNNRSKTVSRNFDIDIPAKKSSSSSSSSSSSKSKSSSTSVQPAQTTTPESPQELPQEPPVVEQPVASVLVPIPFELTITSTNQDGIAYSGRDFSATVEVVPQSSVSGQEWTFDYQIVDDKNNVIAEASEAKILQDGQQTFVKNIGIPLNTTPGDYRIRVTTGKDGVTISSEVGITVKEVPFVNFGLGMQFSYRETVSYTGWILAFLLNMLLVLAGIISREYALFRQSLVYVTEGELGKAGFIAKRKGVSKG